MVKIEGDRLLADLNHLRSFGSVGTGVVRPSFSDVDMSCREWLRSTMSEAGLYSEVDGIGNVFGKSPNPGPALIIGSHSDTQPTGGWLDGALGVAYGLEIARALGSEPTTKALAVDVVAWIDEEGTYLSCLGSRSFCRELTGDQWGSATNSDGESVATALKRVGLDPARHITLDPERHIGYLEAHIEQGPYLDEANEAIGVVSSIVGIHSCRVSFTGMQNHAGTTPMNRRRDAGSALFEFAARLNKTLAQLARPSTVWTIGKAVLNPGAESIIPGHAEFQLQFRDPDADMLAAILEAVVQQAGEAGDPDGVTVSVEAGRSLILPTEMDKGLSAHIAGAAEQAVPGRWRRMPSAAGHDPMVLAHHLPCAMLFIPSIDGISHDFAENSRDEDIVTGCQVLAQAAESILRTATAGRNK